MPWLVSMRMMGDVIGTPRSTIDPHVGDPQIGRFGIGIGVLRKRLQRFSGEESGGQRPGGFLEKGTPSPGGAG